MRDRSNLSPRGAVLVVIAVAAIALLLWRGRESDSPAAPTASGARAPAGATPDEGRTRASVPTWLPWRRAAPPPTARKIVHMEVSTPGVSDPEEAPPPGTLSSEPAQPRELTPLEEQHRRASGVYLREVIKPRVAKCWKAILGRGQIEFRYTFRYQDGTAIPTVPDGADLPVTIVESSLAPDQARRALDCMLDAVADTSYATVYPYPDDPMPGITLYQSWTVGGG